MAMYEYRCGTCGVRWTTTLYGLDSSPVAECPWEDCPSGGEIIRVFSFAFHRPFDAHFNPGMGSVVTSKRDLNDQLARKSEAITERTGIPHQFAYADPRDRDIFPVTHDGLQSTYDHHPESSPIRRAIETVKS